MPNSIKYSTTGDTQSIKKGNFYFGVGDVGKGPSESTGHYQGITPPLNGYTIYANDSGSFTAIYCANNDFQLINFTNGFSNQSFTAVTDCLNWYLSQPNYSCVNRDYESITTDGLLFCLDAGFTPSYTSSGTTIYDISYNGYNGSFSNGPVFSVADGGSISFNAALNQSISVNSNASILPTSAYTKIAWFNCNNFASYNNNIISGGNTGLHAFWLYNSNKLNAGHNNIWNTVVSTTTLSLNTWYCGAVTFDTTNGWSLYLNGVLEDTSLDTTTFTGTGDVQIAKFSGGNNFSGRIAITQVYNRALSSAEILQNFNAQKSRFGI